MQILPEELILIIVNFLDLQDFKNIRFVYRIKWLPKYVKMFSARRIKYEYLNYSKVYKCMRCMQCREAGLSQLIYTNGYSIKHVPWCEAHIDKKLLENIDIFCTKVHFYQMN